MLRPLGSGSFGKVFLGRRRVSDKRYQTLAVKFARDANSAELKREFDMLRDVAHTGVAVAIDFLDGEGLKQLHEPYRKYGAALLMEAASSDLASFLQTHGPCLDAGLIKVWSWTLASAMGALHSKGVIHRDIKPANLLVCLDGVTARPGGFIKTTLKLTDFGSARKMPTGQKCKILGKQPCFDAGANSHFSVRQAYEMTACVCTSWYRAPELLPHTLCADRLDMSPGPDIWYGAPMDVWSYGAVVYEMLAGETLVRANHGAGLLRCLLDRLETCPYPCFDAGLQACLPEYMKSPAWAVLHRAACEQPIRRRPLPEGEAWDVVGACLRWCADARLSMVEVLRQPWFLEAGCVTRASSASSPAIPGSASMPPIPATASTPGRMTLPPPRTWTLADRIQQRTKTPVLQLSVDYSKRAVTHNKEPCQCKGHCRIWEHRKNGKCSDKTRVKGTAYCVRCLCKVHGCTGSKCKGDFCFMHNRIFEQLPAHGQLAVLAADSAQWLVPCDIVDFLDHYHQIKEDLAMCIIWALVKEPRVTGHLLDGWKLLPSKYDALELETMLQSVALVCDSTPDNDPYPVISSQHDKELEQLGRQGVSRFCGFATCLKKLGVIRKVTDHATPRNIIRLGRQKIPYVFTQDRSTLDTFLSCVRSADLHPPCFDAGEKESPAAFHAVLAYSNKLRDLMMSLAESTGLVAKGAHGYSADIIIRKFCLPYWDHVPWDMVSQSSLRTVSADERENLDTLPQQWSAAQVSSFICQRPDWPFLASMYMCLWKEFADNEPEAKNILTKLCTMPPGASMPGESCLTEAAREAVRKFGIALHPSLLIKDIRASTPVNKKKQQEHSPGSKARRASTPPVKCEAPRKKLKREG